MAGIKTQAAEGFLCGSKDSPARAKSWGREARDPVDWEYIVLVVYFIAG